MAVMHQERPRKIDARKALYDGLRPARMVFGGDVASAPLLQSMGVITEDTHQVWVDGSRQRADNGTRLGIKPTSVLNAIVKWAPGKSIREDLSFDLLNLDIAETFPISLGRWLEKNAANIAYGGTIILWAARQFRNPEMLVFHDWFDAFWRQDEGLMAYRKGLALTTKSPDLDNITLNTMLLLACALKCKHLDFSKTFCYTDGWNMVGIRAEVSEPSAKSSIPGFTDITTAFYLKLPNRGGAEEGQISTSVLRKGPKILSRDMLMSDLNVLLGFLSAINLSLIYLDGVWFLTDRAGQEQLYQSTNLENMRAYISGMTIGQTGYLPYF